MTGGTTTSTVEQRNCSTPPPRVSVVIPAYNAAPYIGEALESVLAQTFRDYEVIVINDGSPDTCELEQALQPYLARMVYLKQENGGPSRARNHAIMKARGEYIGFLDADDTWMPNFLAEQMRVFDEGMALDLVYTDALLFGDSELSGKTYMQTVPSSGPVTLDSLLSMKCGIITSCVVARRQAVIAAGLFDEQFFRSEDFDLWLRMAHRGSSMQYQRQVLGRHRIHGGSLASDRTLLLEGQIAVLRKLERELTPLASTTRQLMNAQIVFCQAQIDVELSKQKLIAGQYQQATEALQQANNFYRSPKLRMVLLGLRVAPRLVRRAYELSR